MLGAHLFSFFQPLCAFSGVLEEEHGRDPWQDFFTAVIGFLES